MSYFIQFKMIKLDIEENGSSQQKIKQFSESAGIKWMVKIVFCVHQSKPEATLIGTGVVRTKYLTRTTEMKEKKLKIQPVCVPLSNPKTKVIHVNLSSDCS